jgi:two-component system response regulator ChvI
MSQTSVLKPNEASIPQSYSGLSLIIFRPLSLFSHAHGEGRSRIDSGSPEIGTEKHAPYRIMMVDDEKDITMIFKGALERAGFRVEVFNNPLDALSHFKPDYYDLVLLDVRMPQMSGFELYEQIVKRDKQVKTCFISAFEVYSEELKRYAPNKDEECVIRKPVSTRELVRIIKEELA